MNNKNISTPVAVISISACAVIVWLSLNPDIVRMVIGWVFG